ncbi:retrovirus-related pol polyprotein from transposon TNT 1-94 [Tanacetum coccineum]
MTRCLELLHMDLFDPSIVQSYGENRYTLVIVDDYSRKPTIDYFRVFGRKCFILNTKDYLTKFDPKSYEGVFLGYSQNSKAYIILNKHTKKIEESLNVTFDETPPPSKTSPLVDDDLDKEEAIKIAEKKNLENVIEDETSKIDEIVNIKESRNHPLENVIEMLKKFSLEDSKPMKTPMSSDTKLTKDEEYESVDSTKYRGMIGTTHLGLWYPKGTGIETIVYANSDHAGDYVDQKSTSDREGQVTRIRHQEEVEVQDYQILTREIVSTFKPLEEIIQENVFYLGARLILPYVMLLTRLFDFIIGENPELQNESYVLYDRVMNPLAAQLEQKPRRDRGTRRGCQSTSSSTFDQPSSSYLNDDDDDGNDKGTSRASTPSPIRYVNSLTNQVPQVFQNPPNIDPHLEPFYTRQTEIINCQVQLRDEQRGGVRSIGKSLRRLWRNMKK